MTTPQTQGRGDQTRERLLHAAVSVFGRDGFHAASTRALAGAAGVNQALIGYHFGSKEGLYLAVFEHIAERMSARVAPVAEKLLVELPAIDPGAPDCVDNCIRCIDRVFSALLEVLGENPEASSWVRLIIREQQEPTKAFEILYGRVLSRVLAVLTAIVARASAMAEDDEACRLKALMIISQVIFLLVARTATTRHLEWPELGPEQLGKIKHQALENLRAQLQGEAGT
jgi:AcrR family transcriptional regulator